MLILRSLSSNTTKNLIEAKKLYLVFLKLRYINIRKDQVMAHFTKFHNS